MSDINLNIVEDEIVLNTVEQTIQIDSVNGNTYNILEAQELANLTDVNLTTPAINDVLQYDGTEWINYDIHTEIDSKASAVHQHVKADVTDFAHNHSIADVTNLQTTLDGKALASHTHSISNVTNLQTSLDAKSNTGHTHTIANVTNLATELSNKAPLVHSHSNYAALSHNHNISQINNLQTTLDGKQASLVSGTNIKTINNNSLLGAGNIDIAGGGSTAWVDLTGDPLTNTDLQTLFNNTADINHHHRIDFGHIDDFPIQTGNNGKVLTTNGSALSWTDQTASTVWGGITGDIADQTDLDLILNGLQPALDYTPEDVANKVSTFSATPNDTQYPNAKLVYDSLAGKANTSHSHSISDVTSLQTVLDGKQVVHGFENRTSTTLSFVDGTRTFTITGTNFKVYNNGTLQTKNTENIVIPNTIGVHFIYYNSSNVLTTSTTAWTIGTDMPIALILWNGTNGLIADERHRSSETHKYLHSVFHTMYSSGLSSTFANSTFTIDSGVIFDEDIEISIPTTTLGRIFYRSGSNLTWTSQQANYMQVSGSAQYDNAGTLTAVTSNNYYAIWVYATDLISDGIIFVLGQRQDNTIANARANNTPESLDTSFLPIPEMKLIYRVICRNNATSYIEKTDYRTTSITGSNIVATDHQTLTNRSAIDSHPISSITDLQTTLDGKSATTHNHNLNDLTEKSYNSLTNKPTIPTALSGLTKDINFDERYYTETETNSLLSSKVDVIAGKGLSTEDYTTTEKSKLAGIASGAEVNVNADWNSVSGDSQILNKPTLFSGSYTDLTNKPTIPSTINDLSDVVITTPADNQFLRYDGSNWINETVASGSITTYSVTTANCENTTTETTLASFTIPANSWNDQEIIQFELYALFKNNSGGNVNVTKKYFKDATNLFSATNSTVSTSATEYKNKILIQFTRIGATVSVNNNSSASTAVGGTPANNTYTVDSNNTSGTTIYSDGGVYDFDFTTDIVISFKITFSVANANIYFRPQYVIARKI